jgi:hypothetical protein
MCFKESRSSVDMSPNEIRRSSIDLPSEASRQFSYDNDVVPKRRLSHNNTSTTTTTTSTTYAEFTTVPQFQPPKRRFSDQTQIQARSNSFETRRFSMDTAITELRRQSEDVEKPVGSPAPPGMEEERPIKQLKITRYFQIGRCDSDD